MIRRYQRPWLLLTLILALFAVPKPEPGGTPSDNPAESYCEQVVNSPYGPLAPFGCTIQP